MDKTPISRPAKSGWALLNSTFSGSVGSAPAISYTVPKDVRRKVGSRTINQSMAEQTFVASRQSSFSPSIACWPTPSAASPTPSVASPTPSVASPTPSVASPTPSVASPTPSVASPTPSVASPTPSVASPTPSVASPTPSVASPTPSVASPTPSVASPTPSVASPTPTVASPQSPSVAEKEFEAKLEYNKVLQLLFLECALEETAEKEKTEMDLKLTQLAERCERNVELLDKTHKRLNEISFLSEKQRILEMKDYDCSEFFDQIDTLKAEKILADFTTKHNSYLDRVETNNVDLGYSVQSGHQQLLDAIEDVNQSFDNIKKQSKFTLENLDELSEVNRSCAEVETHLKDLNELERQFSAKFPILSEQTLIQCSENLARRVGEQSDLNELEASSFEE